MSFLTRQSVIAALTANALRPPRNRRLAVPSFAAGWLFGETAPQVLALTALDAAAHLTKSRRTGVRAKAGLALAGASALGLAHMIRQSSRMKEGFEEALVDGLGVDYVEQLDEVPDPADLATTWRRLARPFDFADDGVQVSVVSPSTSVAARVTGVDAPAVAVTLCAAPAGFRLATVMLIVPVAVPPWPSLTW